MGTKQMLFKKGIILLLLMLPGSMCLYADSGKAEPTECEVAGKVSGDRIAQVDGPSQEGEASLPPTLTFYRFEFSYDACGNCTSRTYVTYEPELPPFIEPVDPFEP